MEVRRREGDKDAQRLEAKVPARTGCWVAWRLRAVNAAGAGGFSERSSWFVLALPSRVRELRLQVLPVQHLCVYVHIHMYVCVYIYM